MIDSWGLLITDTSVNLVLMSLLPSHNRQALPPNKTGRKSTIEY